jgi:hypothetical protein
MSIISRGHVQSENWEFGNFRHALSLPPSWDVVQDEKESILASAYEYIENLQRQVQELNDKLDGESAYSDDDDDEEDDLSSCEDDPQLR